MTAITPLRKITFLVLAALLCLGLSFGLGSSGKAHAATVCTTTSSTGGCGPFSDPNVFTSSNGADLVVQNDFSSIPQTLTAPADNSWTVAASTVGFSDQTSVKSYPATQVTYTLPSGLPDPSSDFGATLNSDFTNVVPSGANQDYEYAADDWLADPTKPSWTNDMEIMIWTHVNGQVPAGNDSGKVYTDASGTQWEVWVAGGGSSVGPDSTVSFVRKTNTDSGSFERMGFYKYLQGQGMLASSYGIDQLNYGLEICSTGGSTKTYGISNYTTVPNGTGTVTPPPPPPPAQAPVVSTGTASGVTSSGATVAGSVNPEGADSSYKFEYGTTAAYGSSSATGDAGSGSAAVNESAALTGLSPSTVYHYRLDATNATGTTDGTDATFTTPAVTPPPPPPTGSVVFDAAGGAKVAGKATLSWTQTVGTGANRALMAEVAVGASDNRACAVTVKDGTAALTETGVVADNNQHAGAITTWKLVNPASGVNTLTATVKSCNSGTPNELTGGSESFTGVSQSAPTGTTVTAFGSGTKAAVSAPVASNGLNAGFVANGSPVTSATAPASSKFIENQDSNTGAGNSAGATSATAAMAWSVQNDWWGAIEVPVLPA